MHNMSAGKIYGPDGEIWGFKKWVLSSEVKAIENNKYKNLCSCWTLLIL